MTNNAPRVKCPCCQTEAIWSRTNPHRPFCSQRCKDQDFVAWTNEERTIQGNSVYDDILSEELTQPELTLR